MCASNVLINKGGLHNSPSRQSPPRRHSPVECQVLRSPDFVPNNTRTNFQQVGEKCPECVGVRVVVFILHDCLFFCCVPQSRRAHNIELNGAVVIFDEAHNVVRLDIVYSLIIHSFILHGQCTPINSCSVSEPGAKFQL